MSYRDNEVYEREEDLINKDDAKEQAIDFAAKAINEFLYSISVGNSPQIAFERAVDGETATGLYVPSNLRIEVLP